jgi:hypothetical protein
MKNLFNFFSCRSNANFMKLLIQHNNNNNKNNFSEGILYIKKIYVYICI